MSSRPLGAMVSQVIVAGSSLLLSLFALRELGAAGLGTFSVLFGILLTANAVQTGWIGDSLTVLDRFDPGTRRALFRSQYLAIGIIFVTTASLANLFGGIDAPTAILFGLASAAWGVEETLRRIFMARREFWQLAVNDAAFAGGAFGLLAVVVASGGDVTILTMIAALAAGSTLAIGAATVQLPRIEVERGPLGTSQMRRLASFAGWRAVQVALRPGSLAVTRVIVATAVSLEAVGQLEAARLVVAPALTVVSGVAIYFLPTYAQQAKRRERFRPSIAAATGSIAAFCVGYALFALVAHDVVEQLLTGGDNGVGGIGGISGVAIAAWMSYVLAFGVGLPVGVATIAIGRSRRSFVIRVIDAVVGIALAGTFALAGWVDAAPAGLAIGALLGASLLVRSLRGDPPLGTEPPSMSEAGPVPTPHAPPLPPVASVPWPGRDRSTIAEHGSVPVRRTHVHARLLWIVPLLLIVAIEYKLRRRDIDGALSGTIDPMIAAELLIVGVIGVWALWRLVPSRPRIEPVMMLMWGYILTTAVSSLYSVFPMLALARAVELVIIGAVIQLVSAQGDLGTISRILHGWIVLISSSIVAGLLYVAPTTGPQEGRFTWFSVHSVTTGSMFAVSIPVLFGLWLTGGRRTLPWPRWLYGTLFVVHVVFLLLTRTRGSIGGVAVALAVMAWLSSGRRARPELFLGSLVVGGAVALAFGRPVLEFLTRGETIDQIGTFNRRTEIWALAWESFLERPFLGLGFNSAKGVFFDETGLGGAHNSVINVMIDVGLVGLIWWLLLVGGALVLLGRLRRIERRSAVLLPGATGTARSDHLILIGIFTALLINSITSEGLGAGVSVTAIWLFLACAWLTLLDADQRVTAKRRPAPDRPERRRLETDPASLSRSRPTMPA